MSVNVRELKKGSGKWYIFINHRGERRAVLIGPEDEARGAAERIKAVLKKVPKGQRLADIYGLPGSERKGSFKPVVFHAKAPRGNVPTVAAYSETWLDELDGHKSRSTISQYRFLLKKHILPALGDKRLDEVTKRDIRDFINAKQKAEKLSTRYVRGIRDVLSGVMKLAMGADDLIDENPCKGKIEELKTERPPKIATALSREERDRLENVYREFYPDHYNMITVGFRLGARRGELIAFQWDDINWAEKTITFNRHITQAHIEPGTKTSKPNEKPHEMRLSTRAIEALEDQRRLVAVWRREYKWRKPSPWVFPFKNTGNFLHINRFTTDVWNPALDRAGIKRRGMHTLRHSYVNQRIAAGHPLDQISKELGHKTFDFTYRVYQEWVVKQAKLHSIDDLDSLPNGLQNRNASI